MKWATVTILVLGLSLLVMWSCGLFTKYAQIGTLQLVQKGQYFVSAFDPEYPVEESRSWRLPWQQKSFKIYVLPVSAEGGTYYLPPGEILLDGTIEVNAVLDLMESGISLKFE